MKIKHTFIAASLICGTSLFAGNPLFQKKEAEKDLLHLSTTAPKKKLMANSEGKSNIVVKMNLTQLAFKNLSFQGEYGFHKKMSVALGVSYLIQRAVPSQLYDPKDNTYGSTFSSPTYGGFAITPEFRFYPGGKEDKPAPNGFYIAAYLRYAKYNLKQTVSYQDNSSAGSPVYSADATQTYAGVNAGLMIGRQWIIGKHFSIDWWIVGAGYGKAKYTYTWQDPGANLSADQQDQVKQGAQQNFNNFSAFGLTTSAQTTNNSVTMAVSGLPMLSIRFMGLCVGYAF